MQGNWTFQRKLRIFILILCFYLEPVQGSEFLRLEPQASMLFEPEQQREFVADADITLLIRNLTRYRNDPNLAQLEYRLNDKIIMQSNFDKYALIVMHKGDQLHVANVGPIAGEWTYYRSHTIIMIAFVIFAVALIGVFVSLAYYLTYRNMDYFYNSIFSIAVTMQIVFHFTSFKWDYITFSVMTTSFLLLLLDDHVAKRRMFLFMLFYEAVWIGTWDQRVFPDNVMIAVVYNKIIAAVCVLIAAWNLVKKRKRLIAYACIFNVLSIGAIADFFPVLAPIYPFSHCVYILAFSTYLIKKSVKDERIAIESSRELAIKNQDLQAHQAVITDLNQNLEQKIDLQTRDIRAMLDQLPQGVFSVGKDMTILKDYSRALASILQTTDIIGQSLRSLLIDPISNLSPDEKDQFHQVVFVSLDESEFAFIVNVSKLPSLIQYKGKWLRCTYSPILNSNELVEKLTITLLDVSKELESEASVAQEREKLSIVGELMNVRSDQALAFFGIAHACLEDLEMRLQHETSRNDCQELMVHLHTLKGVARSHSFKKLTSVIHEAESIYADGIVNGGILDRVRAAQDVETLRQTLEMYQDINMDTLNRQSEQDSTALDRMTLQAIDRALCLASTQAEFQPGLQRLLEDSRYRLAVATGQTLESLVQESNRTLPLLATQLGKETPEVEYSGAALPLMWQQITALQHAFLHILRNAIDHGIESADEREIQGKTKHGKIVIRAAVHSQNLCCISIQDDGRGLALEKIRVKALEKGLNVAQRSAVELANLIFESGFSTAENLSEVSGRGIGMDAVRSFMESLGGTARIELLPGRSAAEAYRAFVIHLQFPLHETITAEDLRYPRAG